MGSVGLLSKLKNSLVFASFFSAITVILIHVFVFPLGTMNADELVYQKMAAAFLAGETKIAVDPILGSQTPPWLMFNVGNWSVPKYQPLFAFFLIPGLFFGMWLPLSVLAFACTYSVGKLAEAFSASPLRAAWLWNGSAAFLLSASATLPYLFSLELGILMMLTAIKSQKNTYLKLAVLFALALLCRPLDAIIFAIAVAAILYQRGILNRWRDLAKSAIALVLATFPALLWNIIQTGDLLQFPFTLTSSFDSWGFGVRKVYDSDAGTSFTVWDGFSATANNLGRVLIWTFGGIVMLPLAYLAIRRNFIKYRLSVIVWALAWIIGYGSFWGSYTTIRFWNGPDYLGPYYWLPLSLILILLISSVPKSVLHSTFMWAVSFLLAVGITIAILLRNLLMTDAWKESELLSVLGDQNSVIKLDDSYTTHIGRPIQLIANTEDSRKFSLDWSGVAAIIEDSKIASPKIYIAVPGESTKFDYLPQVSRVRESATAPSVSIESGGSRQLQISTGSRCVFKSIPANKTLDLVLSDQSIDASFTGICSERVEPNEVTFKIFDTQTGEIQHRYISYFDNKSETYFYARF